MGDRGLADRSLPQPQIKIRSPKAAAAAAAAGDTAGATLKDKAQSVLDSLDEVNTETHFDEKAEINSCYTVFTISKVFNFPINPSHCQHWAES